MRAPWLILLVGCQTSSAPTVTAPDGAVDAVSPTLGAAEDVLTGLDDPNGVAVDATHFYLSYGRGSLARVAKTDGTTLEPIASGQRGPSGIDVTTDRVCWLNLGTHAADFLDGSIQCAPKAGGPPQLLSSAYMPSGIAIADDTLYWVEIDGQRLRAIGVDGQDPRTLDSSPTSKTSIAISGTTLAWTASGTGADVVVMELPAGDPRVLSTVEYSPGPLVLLGDHVYWVSQQNIEGDGAVRVSRDGGAPMDLVPGERHPRSLVHVAGTLYWTSGTRVRAASIGGGLAITLAEARESPSTLVTDGTYLYWTELYRGALVRLRL
jgi:hypothetical protein